MTTKLIHNLEKPYQVFDLHMGEYITVLAPSPLGALYNANLEQTGRIPNEPLRQGKATLSLGDFAVRNEYL